MLSRINKDDKGFSFFEVIIVILVIFALILGGVYVYHKRQTAKSSTGINNPSLNSFNYGFDFDAQGPDPTTQDIYDTNNNPAAVTNAKKVLKQFAGVMMDQSLYGFGANNDPEPSPGNYDLGNLTARINLITSAGGIPVMTLINAPAWMHPSSSTFSSPPDPQYYQAYANLCAYVAKSYPQVKYFTVWSEIRGFDHYDTTNWGAAQYTNMYNDIYTAIKAVRPDAKIGGPYAIMTATSTPLAGSNSSTLHGSWGYVNPAMQNALSYWLAHKVGADYLAVDGATEIARMNDNSLTDPVTASDMYTAVDQWLKSQTNLPIWWMESHIAPSAGWSDQEGAAARIATLLQMNTSGASVGMQWQPQGQDIIFKDQKLWPDEGLWTSLQSVNGGQPTVLANKLLSALPVIRQPLNLVTNEPRGVIVAQTASHNSSVLVNTTESTVNATLNGKNVSLRSYQVITNN